MNKPRRHAFPGWSLLLLGVLSCGPDQIVAPSAQSSSGSHLDATGPVRQWTVILTDTGGRVWVAQADAGAPTVPTDGVWSGPAALWSRLDSEPAARGLTLSTAIAVRRDRGQGVGKVSVLLRWRLQDQNVQLAHGEGLLLRDERYGVWRTRGLGTGALEGGGGGGASVSREGLRFDLFSDTPMPADSFADPVASGSVVVRTPGVVSLRIDDCNGKDAVAFRMLRAFGLTAAMGVPSQRIDRHGYCTQRLLQAMVAAGNLVEAHSRTHGAAPTGFGEFYLETVGAAQELRSRGFDPHVFIPPGTWRAGPTLFDSQKKLVGPYGALLRRVYGSTEAYAQPAVLRVPATGRNGPSSWPLKAFSVEQLEARVRRAAADSQWVSFMWHAWDMPPAELEARLRVIAALRDSGLVTVLPYYSALHATRE